MNKLHNFTIITGKYLTKGMRTTGILAKRFYAYELTSLDKDVDLCSLRLIFDKGEKTYTDIPFKEAENIILDFAKRQNGGWLKRFVR